MYLLVFGVRILSRREPLTPKPSYLFAWEAWK